MTGSLFADSSQFERRCEAVWRSLLEMAEKFWSRSNVRIGAAMRMFSNSDEVRKVPKGTGVFTGRAHHCEVLGAELGLVVPRKC